MDSRTYQSRTARNHPCNRIIQDSAVDGGLAHLRLVVRMLGLALNYDIGVQHHFSLLKEHPGRH